MELLFVQSKNNSTPRLNYRDIERNDQYEISISDLVEDQTEHVDADDRENRRLQVGSGLRQRTMPLNMTH